MSRRVTLPGADELFRSTAPAGTPAAAPAAPAQHAAPQAAPNAAPGAQGAPAGPGASGAGAEAPSGSAGHPAALPDAPPLAAVPDDDDLDAPAPVRRRPRPVGERRPTGRERHDEKITVYCSAEELIDIERARLTLRGEYGVAADRGRIVREALAVVLADLEAKGDQSILVRRLRGR